jgi:hypothetical protein
MVMTDKVSVGRFQAILPFGPKHKISTGADWVAAAKTVQRWGACARMDGERNGRSHPGVPFLLFFATKAR